MSEISIVIPTYNEKEIVKETILALSNLLPWVEIIVVDDNSPDGTAKLVADLAREYKNLKLIQRKTRGLAKAIAAGIAGAGGDIVVWMDCDTCLSADTVRQLIAVLENGYDIALASRYVPGGQDARRSWLRRQASRFINSFARVVLSSGVSDLTSGFVATRKAVFDRVLIRGDYGEYCIDFLVRAQRKGFKVKEIPYQCRDRLKGRTKTAADPFTFLYLGLTYFLAVFKLKLAGVRERKNNDQE